MRIKSIEIEHYDNPVPVYDVVNAAPYHNFLVKCNSGYIVSHNCGLLDEVDFVGGANVDMEKSKIMKIYRSVKRRMQSRFLIDGGKLFTKLFLVSSKKSDQDFLESYIETVRNDSTVLIVDEPIWVIKPANIYSGKKFHVAIGNKTLMSRVVQETDDINALIVQGYKIMEVPIEYWKEFNQNVESSLMEFAGVSSTLTSKFISYQKLSDSYCSTPNPFSVNIVSIGTNDDLQLEDFFKPELVPELVSRKPIFIHIDASLTGDRTGISGVAVMGYRETSALVNGEVEQVLELIYRHVFTVGIQCPSGAEISLQKNRSFIYYLKFKLGWNIAGVSLDGYQCLPADTLIKTNNGNKRIVDLDETKDKVLSIDLRTRKFGYTSFTNLRQTGVAEHLKVITTVDGRVIKCTSNHKILIWQTGYTEARNTNVYQDIVAYSPNVSAPVRCRIKSVTEERYPEAIPVYDIEVPLYYNFVLANGLVVHNSADSKQQFLQAGFDARIISLDRTSDGYMYLKASINEKRISTLKIPELETEIINLERNNMTGKVDHPATGCLPADTKIITSNGVKCIIDLDQDIDQVLSYDVSYGLFLWCKFENLRETKRVSQLYSIKTSDKREIRCTDNHYILTADFGYIMACDLKCGMSLMSFDPDLKCSSESKIESITLIDLDEEIPVYDIEVPIYSNFVLENNLIVHNSKDLCLSSDTEVFLIPGYDVKIGDLYNMDYRDFWVLSFDTKNKEFVPSKINKVIRKDSIPKSLIRITFDNGKSISVTDDHLILNKLYEYSKASELSEGDSLVIFDINNPNAVNDRYRKVVKIERVSNSDYVYDIQLDMIHNFAVSSGIFVHNCDSLCGALYNASQYKDDNALHLADDYESMMSVNTDSDSQEEYEKNAVSALSNEISSDIVPAKDQDNMKIDFDSVFNEVKADEEKAAKEALNSVLDRLKQYMNPTERNLVSDSDLEEALNNDYSSDILMW